MDNRWNRIIYKYWSPIYDRFFNSGIFLKTGQEIFNDLSLKKGCKILFIGVGTGADLPYFLKKDCEITAIDFSADMLNFIFYNIYSYYKWTCINLLLY